MEYKEWEDTIDSLYLAAKKKQERLYTAKMSVIKKENKREKFSLLDKLKRKWGL